MPTTRPPIAGHHIQWIGSCRKRVLRRRRPAAVSSAESEAGGQPDKTIARGHAGPANVGVRGDGEDRAGAEQVAAQRAGGDAGDRDGDEAARLPLEEQQLDRQEDGRDRRGEDRRHAGRGARHQQRLALGVGEMEELGEERAEGAAGHDDRAFGAERAAGADRDRRGERLQDGDPRLDPAAVEQDRLEASGMPWPRMRSEPKRAIRPTIMAPVTLSV